MNATLVVTLVVAIVGVFAGSGFWRFLETRMDKKDKEMSVDREALMGLLHAEIYRRCKAAINKGYITVAEYDDLRHLSAPYFELGGNDTGKMLVAEVERLDKVTGLEPIDLTYEKYYSEQRVERNGGTK